MANNFFNFKIPNFNLKYGQDWDAFQNIMEENTDYYFGKAWKLYELTQLNKSTNPMIEVLLSLLNMTSSSTDTLKTKKLKIRGWVTKFVDKGLGVMYLDISKQITGQDGILYNGAFYGPWRWGSARHGVIRWPQLNAAFTILFNVKTTDDTELDQIVDLLRDKDVLSAFYLVYLIDDDGVVLRTI